MRVDAPKESVWRYGQNEGIRGAKIVLTARKVTAGEVGNRTHTHKAGMAVGDRDAEAWIERPLRAVAERGSSPPSGREGPAKS